MIRRIPRSHFNQFLHDYYHMTGGGLTQGHSLARAFKATFEIKDFNLDVVAHLEEADLIAQLEIAYVDSNSGLVH